MSSRGGHRRPATAGDGLNKRVCKQYMMDQCSYDPCRFVHDADLCFDFWRHGSCDSTTCGKKHPAAFKGQGNNERPTNREAQQRLPLERREETSSKASPPSQSASGGAGGEQPRNRRAQNQRGRQPVDDEYAGSNRSAPAADLPRGKGLSRLPRPKVNTESFVPSHEPCTMRVVVDLHPTRLSIPLTVRDVLYAPSIFSQPGDERLYEVLSQEISHCTIPEADLLKSWHGDSHWIADDSTGWKKQCPTFVSVVERLRTYFKADIKATRFNWYKDTSEWKPYHHDAAAVKPDKARTQNFTIGVSFGATRTAAFEDAKTRTTVAFPLPHGSVYCFSRDTNILWRHGILQEKNVKEEGRISIIAWGWVDQDEC